MGLFSFLTKSAEQSFLERVAAAVGGGDVRHLPNDQIWEWRGTISGHRARVEFGSVTPVGYVVPKRDHGSFVLKRDPALVKGAGDSPDEAWSEDSAVRLFVGPGQYLESFAFSMPEESVAFGHLPGADRLLGEMGPCAACAVNASKDEFVLSFERKVKAEQVAQFLRVVTDVVAQPSGAPAPSPGETAAHEGDGDVWASKKLRCRYCEAVFLLSQSGKCPNCGAPAA